MLRRIPVDKAAPPANMNDSSSSNEGTSNGARQRRPSNTTGPSSAEGSDRGYSPFRPPMMSTMATPDEGTDKDSAQSKKRKKAARKSTTSTAMDEESEDQNDSDQDSTSSKSDCDSIDKGKTSSKDAPKNQRTLLKRLLSAQITRSWLLQCPRPEAL